MLNLEGVELKWIPLPRNEPNREMFKFVHFKLETNLLCLKAKGEEQKIGRLYLISHEISKVNCPECLEMAHA